MIYTVTFNPSLDYIVDVPDFQLHRTNRTTSERMVAGGKGINVSIVLHNLGIPSCALGFIAGFTGEEIRRKVEEMGIRAQFIQLETGNSRINMKLRTHDGTEINGMGPDIAPAQIQQLMRRLDSLRCDDILVLAGSIPPSMPPTIYSDMMKRLDGTGVMVVVDATKELLCSALPYHPFLIKPNHHELGELFGVTITARDAVIPYARKLQQQGARNVLVSMAGQGAVLVAEDGTVYDSPAPKGRLVNAVGAGDAMVAGFVAGYAQTHDYQHAFRLGLSAGSASAFSQDFATREQIETIYYTL